MPHEPSEDWGSLGVALADTRFGDVRRVAETGSTNADLAALARDGAPEGVVLVADHQTAGRGRLGRSWEAPPGASLLVSILVRPPIGPEDIHLVTTALGVAAAEACRHAGVEARIKWPNDLVVEGSDGIRKVSGMLGESIVEDGRLQALVLGIGINVNWPETLPEDLAEIAVSMNHVTGQPVDRPAVLATLLRGFDRWYGTVGDGSRGTLLGRYRELSATIGRRVRVELGAETIVGDAVDLDSSGRLLVVDECPDRPREIAAGDVVHLRPAR